MNSNNNAQCEKRILLVSLSPFPYGTGANSNFLTNFSVGLKKNGHDIELLIQNQLKTEREEFQEINYRGCGGYGSRSKVINTLRSRFLNIFFPSLYLFRKRKSINYVITFQNDFINTVFLLISSKILSKPYIHIQVDYYDWETFSRNKGGIKKRIRYLNYSLRHNFLNRFVNGSIVVSTFLKNHYVSLGIKEENVLLQPHLVKVDNFDEVRREPIFQNEIISFGVLGSINHHNGITDLLVAFKEVTDKNDKVELMLIGGSEQDFNYCKEKAKELHLPGKIKYIGKVHYTKLAGVMKKCDAFILPRPASTEAIAGFPTKVGEFLSSKRPMIITNYGDIPVYFKDQYNALLANSSDPGSIAKKITYIIEHPDKAKEIAQNGYNWVVNTLEYISSTKRIGLFLDNLKSK